jgi:hypothetical protein
MTPQDVFEAWTLLSAIPPDHVLAMRRVLDNARHRLATSQRSAVVSAVTQTWTPKDEALAWLIDITRDCWCVWSNRRVVHSEWWSDPELTDETIH